MLLVRWPAARGPVVRGVCLEGVEQEGRPDRVGGAERLLWDAGERTERELLLCRLQAAYITCFFFV